MGHNFCGFYPQFICIIIVSMLHEQKCWEPLSGGESQQFNGRRIPKASIVEWPHTYVVLAGQTAAYGPCAICLKIS